MVMVGVGVETPPSSTTHAHATPLAALNIVQLRCKGSQRTSLKTAFCTGMSSWSRRLSVRPPSCGEHAREARSVAHSRGPRAAFPLLLLLLPLLLLLSPAISCCCSSSGRVDERTPG